MKPSSITHSIFLRLQTQSNLAPLPEDLALKPRLYQRNGYKGNVRASKAQHSSFFSGQKRRKALDAVAQLYQHHGLEKPSVSASATRSSGVFH